MVCLAVDKTVWTSSELDDRVFATSRPRYGISICLCAYPRRDRQCLIAKSSNSSHFAIPVALSDTAVSGLFCGQKPG